MLRSRDARAASGGCGMVWIGRERRKGEHRGVGGLMGRKGRREPGSRGARWVMLRDETPRGFIEQRRKKEERRKERREEKSERKREEGSRMKRERGAARKRGAETCFALILKSTLVGLAPSPLHQPCAFSFLSFSTFRPYEMGAAARRKSNRPPVVVSWG